MFIDAHTHVLPPEIIEARSEYISADRWFGMLYASPRARLACAPDLLASMDRSGIDASVAFGFGFRSGQTCRLCNDYVLDAAARLPGRILPLAVVSPAEGDAAILEAERCLDAGALGIGELMPDGQGFEFGGETLEPLLQMLKARGAPLMLHVNERVGHEYAGKGQSGPEEAYALAARHPELRLILSHWGGGLPFYELMPTARKTLANVWYDTAASPLLYDDQVFAHVMNWAPSKVVFGTDYPLLAQGRFVRRVLALDMPSDRLAGLFAGNVLQALGRAGAQSLPG